MCVWSMFILKSQNIFIKVILKGEGVCLLFYHALPSPGSNKNFLFLGVTWNGISLTYREHNRWITF